MLRSWPFSLEHGSRHQLLLQHRDGDATTGYFVTVGVELRQHTGVSMFQICRMPYRRTSKLLVGNNDHSSTASCMDIQQLHL